MKRLSLSAAVALILTGLSTADAAQGPPVPHQNHQQRPSWDENRPRNNNDWIGPLIGIIGTAAINEIQQHQDYQPPYYPQQQQQYYPPHQPVYQQQYIQQPQVVYPQQPVVQPAPKPVVQPKKNVIPKITKPVALKNNFAPLSAKVATKTYSRDVSLRLNQDINSSLGDLQQGLEDAGVIMSAKGLQDTADFLKQAGVPDSQIQALVSAIKANDPNAIQAAANAIGLDKVFMTPGMTDSLITGANVGQQMQDIQTQIANGASPDQVAQMAGQLATSLQQLNLPKVLQQGLMDEINQVVLANDILNGISNNPPVGPQGSMTDLPTGGDCQIICDPNLAAGSNCMLPGGAVCVGTGGTGPMELMNGSVAAAMGLPASEDAPVPDTEGTAPVLGNSALTVMNPEDSGATVSYVLGGQSFTLAPGQSQPHGSTNQLIEFDRGGEFGKARYTLDSGTFKFAVSEQGWGLVKAKFTVTI